VQGDRLCLAARDVCFPRAGPSLRAWAMVAYTTSCSI
jgi:hypothetical protein